MESLSMYHGAISKEAAEKILVKAGVDGSYLLRDSETVPNCYCLCILCELKVCTYRVYQIKNELWYVETTSGIQPRRFRNLKNLIAAFGNPNQGLEQRLLQPVEHDAH